MKIVRSFARVLPLLLLSCLLVACMTTAHAGYDDVTFTNFAQFTDNTFLLSRLDVALKQYPVGSWFNKIGTGPCTCHGNSSIANHYSDLEGCDCLRVFTHPETGAKINTGSGQCQAYAYYIFNILFGQNLKGAGSKLMIRDDSLSLTKENVIGMIEAANAGFGAHIRIGTGNTVNHSMILLGYDSSSITYLNCNLIDVSSKQCRIAVTTRPWSAFESQYSKRTGMYIETPTIKTGASSRNVVLSKAVINEGDQELQIGDTVNLTCTIDTSSMMSADGLFSGSWTSSDENVVTVDSNGLLTAVGGGEATVAVQTKFGVKGSIAVLVDEDREPCYGAVVVMHETEFCSRPASDAGTGDYAQRSDVLNVFSIVTDPNGVQWYALARRGGYYIEAEAVDLLMGFPAEPVRLLPVDASVSTDWLNAKVGEVLYVYPTIDSAVTGGQYSYEVSRVSSADPSVAEFAGEKGGRLTVRSLGETTISIDGYITTPENERVFWRYTVPLKAEGVAGIANSQRYEVVYASGLRMRSLPTTDSETVVLLASGSFFTADMDRTAEADGYTWAYAEADSGETGWVAISNNSYCRPVSDYTLVQAATGDNGHRYLVYKGAGDWDKAATFAASLGEGWHLATITSAEEQACVSRLVSAYGGTCWLGGTYSGGWTWMTGEAFDYTNWDDGEPGGNSSEPYLGIYGNSTQTSYATDGKWNDFKATTGTVNGFVAEMSNARTVTFSPDAMLLYTGSYMFLNPRVEPELGASETLRYFVQDPEIVSVDSDGRVTALKEGVTEVAAEAPDGTAGTIRMYVFGSEPVMVGAHELRVGIGAQHMINLGWNEDAPMRQYIASYEINEVFTDSDHMSWVEDVTFRGERTGVTNLYYDLTYTTVEGEILYDTLMTPVVVGDIFVPEREHYECAVGDTVKILYQIQGDTTEYLNLRWETSSPQLVTVDQNGCFTVHQTGYPAIEVYATWASIPVGYIDLSFLEYTTARLPEQVTVLEQEALRGISVERIDARGTGLKRIESGAFADIDDLRSICLDDSVEYIAPDAFEGSSLIWIHCPEGSYAHQWAVENGYYVNLW